MFTKDFFVVEVRSATALGLGVSSWHEDYSLRPLFSRVASRRWIRPTAIHFFDAGGQLLLMRAFDAFADFNAAKCLYEDRVALFAQAQGAAYAAHRIFLWRAAARTARAALRVLDDSGDPVALTKSDYRFLLAQMRAAREG